MNQEANILVVCGDERQLGELCHELRADGHSVQGTHSAAEAAARAHSVPPRLVVLGALQEPLEQLALLRAIRAETIEAIDSQVGVIVLGRAGGRLEVVRCLDAGADDYLDPSADYLELRARLAAVTRRLYGRTQAVKRVGALEIDARQREARYDGHSIELSRVEFALLCELAEDPTRVLTKSELLKSVWGYPDGIATRTLDSHACRLRAKLGAAGAGNLVINVWGVGYRLMDGTSHQTQERSSPVALVGEPPAAA